MSPRPVRTLLCLGLLTGCVAEVVPEVGDLAVQECDPADHDPSIDVSFEMDVLPLLEERCGCHDPEGAFPVGVRASGFSIGGYDALLAGGDAGEDTVLAGDPCDSILIQKIGEAPPFGTRMPQFGPYLTEAERALLHDWIAEGAQK